MAEDFDKGKVKAESSGKDNNLPRLEEFPQNSADSKVQQSPLQPSPELTPEQLSGKQTPQLPDSSRPLTPHPPDGKPTGRPSRLASAASKDSIPEELPISQDEDEHPPPEVDEKIEVDANQSNQAALDSLAEKARALAAARAKEKLEAPPEELEEEQPRPAMPPEEDDDSEGSMADELPDPRAAELEPPATLGTPRDVDEGNSKGVHRNHRDSRDHSAAWDIPIGSEDGEHETMAPHPPEGKPTKRPNPQLKQVLRGSADDVNSPEEKTFEAQAEAAARALFEELDLNSDGLISRHELKAKMAMDDELEQILGLHGVGHRSQLMYRLWEARRKLDTDGDGYISQDELVQLLQPQAARCEATSAASPPPVLPVAVSERKQDAERDRPTSYDSDYGDDAFEDDPKRQESELAGYPHPAQAAPPKPPASPGPTLASNGTLNGSVVQQPAQQLAASAAEHDPYNEVFESDDNEALPARNDPAHQRQHSFGYEEDAYADIVPDRILEEGEEFDYGEDVEIGSEEEY